jgi:hypothetical protein
MMGRGLGGGAEQCSHGAALAPSYIFLLSFGGGKLKLHRLLMDHLADVVQPRVGDYTGGIREKGVPVAYLKDP